MTKTKRFFLKKYCFAFIESLAASMPEAVHYTRRSAMYYNGGSQALLSNNTPLTTPKKRTYRGPDKNQLFGRRHDGVYVRYICLF